MDMRQKRRTKKRRDKSAFWETSWKRQDKTEHRTKRQKMCDHVPLLHFCMIDAKENSFSNIALLLQLFGVAHDDTRFAIETLDAMCRLVPLHLRHVLHKDYAYNAEKRIRKCHFGDYQPKVDEWVLLAMEMDLRLGKYTALMEEGFFTSFYTSLPVMRTGKRPSQTRSTALRQMPRK